MMLVQTGEWNEAEVNKWVFQRRDEADTSDVNKDWSHWTHKDKCKDYTHTSECNRLVPGLCLAITYEISLRFDSSF